MYKIVTEILENDKEIWEKWLEYNKRIFSIEHRKINLFFF